jgi:hypothetical protein
LARRPEIEATIVGVGSRGNEANMAEFVDRHDLDDVHMVGDYDSKVWAANGIGTQPAWVFIDGETGEAKTHFGELSLEGLVTEIEALQT